MTDKAVASRSQSSASKSSRQAISLQVTTNERSPRDLQSVGRQLVPTRREVVPLEQIAHNIGIHRPAEPESGSRL